jgi:hypothetical protein
LAVSAPPCVGRARYHESRDDDLNGLVVLVPTTGGQSSEDRIARGFLVEMEWLRIEFGANHLDSLLVDLQPTGAKRLADGKVSR